MIQFDCHAHVYETTQAVPGARYRPKAPAPLADWLKNLDHHGLKGGVIVQVSFLGADNSELCAALSKLDKTRFAGVAVVPLNVEDAELQRLIACGVRGVRWNLVRNGFVPDLEAPSVRSFLAKLRNHDLHLEVHLEGHRLAPYVAPLADQGVNIVIDHFGLPSDPDAASDPFLKAIKDLKARANIFVKLSAKYRTGFDISRHLETLNSLLPSHQTLWGSDWPHTQHEEAVDYRMTHEDAAQFADTCDANSVRKLYGLEPNGI